MGLYRTVFYEWRVSKNLVGDCTAYPTIQRGQLKENYEEPLTWSRFKPGTSQIQDLKITATKICLVSYVYIQHKVSANMNLQHCQANQCKYHPNRMKPFIK
jgi:hypothetical protein